MAFPISSRLRNKFSYFIKALIEQINVDFSLSIEGGCLCGEISCVAKRFDEREKTVEINISLAHVENTQIGSVLVFTEAVIYVEMSKIVDYVSIIRVVN